MQTVHKGLAESIIFTEHISENCLGWLKDAQNRITSVLRHFKKLTENLELKMAGNDV